MTEKLTQPVDFCLGVDNTPLEGLDLSQTTHTEINTYLADPWVFTDPGGNYNSTNGTVDSEITKRFITVVADAKGKFIGQADPELTFQVVSGSLLAGDSFSGELTGNQVRLSVYMPSCKASFHCQSTIRSALRAPLSPFTVIDILFQSYIGPI